MTTFEMQESSILPENTVFQARLEEAEVITKPKRDGGSFEKLKLVWRIFSPEKYDQRKLTEEIRPELTVDAWNPLRKRAEALLNREIPMGGQLDLEDMIGLKCQLSVIHRDRNDGQGKYVNVDEVFPMAPINETDEPPF